MLSPGLERDIDRARFLKEGRLAASLDHPNCVYVFGALELDGRLVIVMELMRETLADRLKQGGRLPHAVAVDAMLQIIAGLEAAETVGILHRDVKPSNCFVDEEGRVKIGDFGISISAHPSSETGMATGHRIVGTPGYASPEQLRGDTLDARADIYGVGATLYQLVTGHPPFDKRDLMSLLMAVANEEPRAPIVCQRTIPRGLSQVVQRCLAKTPERRFGSHAALAAACRTTPRRQRRPRRRPSPRGDGDRPFDPVLADRLDPCHQPVPGLRLGWHRCDSHGRLDGGARRDFAVLEGIWGASIGKACVGIRVTRPDGRPAGLVRAMCRTVLFVLPFDVFPLVVLATVPEVVLKPGSEIGFGFIFPST